MGTKQAPFICTHPVSLTLNTTSGNEIAAHTPNNCWMRGRLGARGGEDREKEKEIKRKKKKSF